MPRYTLYSHFSNVLAIPSSSFHWRTSSRMESEISNSRNLLQRRNGPTISITIRRSPFEILSSIVAKYATLIRPRIKEALPFRVRIGESRRFLFSSFFIFSFFFFFRKAIHAPRASYSSPSFQNQYNSPTDCYLYRGKKISYSV